MLTALSVSRDCNMIEADESVVLVHAQEPGTTLQGTHVSNDMTSYDDIEGTSNKLHIEWLVDEQTPLHDVKIKVPM